MNRDRRSSMDGKFSVTIPSSMIGFVVQILEPNSAMRTMLPLDEALDRYAQFSAFAAGLLVGLIIFCY